MASGTSRPETHFGILPPIDIHEALGLVEPAGATPSSLLLATLGTCRLERIRANAAIGNITVTNLVLDIEADLAVCPLWEATGAAPGPAGSDLIQVKIYMDADAPEARAAGGGPALDALVAGGQYAARADPPRRGARHERRVVSVPLRKPTF